MQLVQVKTPGRIRASFVGGDGESVAPSDPKVTIVRDSDGATIADDANATTDGAAAAFALDPATIPTVDLLTATFTDESGATVEVQVAIVGGFLCSLEAIETASGESDPLVLRTMREQAERKLEDSCNVAFRPRYTRETLNGDDTSELLLSRPRPLTILSATLDGVDILSQLSLASGGTVCRSATFPAGSELDIAYAHGWPSCPDPMSRAAVKLASVLAPGSGDDRISRFREDDQEVWLTTAGVDGAATSIPEVNAAIEDYRYTVVG